MKVIAIIPARGGSKRIPDKNIIDFMGKPMMVWTIEAAIRSGIFHRIVVSTDDESIAQIARDAGIDVPFLRVGSSDDFSPVSQATIEAVEQARNHWLEDYDITIQLMANCPLRKAADIIDAFNHFTENKLSCQISSFKFGWMNPWWAARLDQDLRPDFLHKESLKARSQDLEQLYCPTGAIWISRTSDLIESRTFHGEDRRFFPMDWKSAVDIDDFADLEFAKAVSLLRDH